MAQCNHVRVLDYVSSISILITAILHTRADAPGVGPLGRQGTRMSLRVFFPSMARALTEERISFRRRRASFVHSPIAYWAVKALGITKVLVESRGKW